MAVPNTETFTLQDVANEIGGGLTSLQACFDNANSGGFDPAYNQDSYAPANSLLRFRNYSHVITITPSVEVDIRTSTETLIVFRLTLSSAAISSFSVSINRINRNGQGVTVPAVINVQEGSNNPGIGSIEATVTSSSYTASMTITSNAPNGYVFSSTSASVNVPAV